MNATRFLLGAALLAATAGTASAQVTLNWAGLHVGGQLGFAAGSSDVNTQTVYSTTGYFAQGSVTSINATGPASLSPKGLTAGVAAGYDIQKGALVYGLEATGGLLSLSADRTVTVVYPGFAPTSYTLKQKTTAGMLMTLRARAGRMMGSNLVSLSAGLAMASVKIDDHFTDTFASAVDNGSASNMQSGWIAGAAFEHALNGGWSVMAEAFALDLGKKSASGTVLKTVSGATTYTWPQNPFTYSSSLSATGVRVGVNFRS